jgi:hypothetical protein
MTSPTYYIRLAVIFLIMQAAFAFTSMKRIPDLGVVPDLSSEQELRLLSFGDGQLLFRIMAFRLNNTGDTFGRFIKLSDYNMKKIHTWFTRLDAFDATANHLPSMAAYYFSQTQNHKDVRHLVDYLYEHSYYRPSEKWWWLTQGVYLAMHKLKDDALALKIAEPLVGVKGIPYWAQQMPAFVHEKRGEFEDAATIMKNILAEDDALSQGELNYIRYFMDERLKRLKEVESLLDAQQMRIKQEGKAEDAPTP